MADDPCIAAGFFVSEAGPLAELRSPDLLPARLVSMSPCIARSYQVYWGWDPATHRDDALAFGVAEDRSRTCSRGSVVTRPPVARAATGCLKRTTRWRHPTRC